MVIDFRIRPPFRQFAQVGIFAGHGVKQNESHENFNSLDRTFIPSVRYRSIEMFVEEMNQAGIIQGVIMGRRCNQTVGAAAGDVPNDEIKELCDLYEGRFIGFGGITPFEKNAVEEVTRCLTSLNFKGIALDPGWYTTPLRADDPLLDPIYEECNRLNGIACITTSVFLGPDVTYSHPVHIQNVANKYPNMKIVVPHACWPYIDLALGVALMCPNVYLAPDCYLYTPQAPMAEELVKAANTYLKDRILFNSSYPIRGLVQSVEEWKKRGFEPDALRKTLLYNAVNLLGL